MTETTTGHRLGSIDRGLYALFSRHADRKRHTPDRQRYRQAGIETSFDLYIARVYGIAWSSALGTALLVLTLAVALPDNIGATVGTTLKEGLPILNQLSVPGPTGVILTVGLSLVGAGAIRWSVIKAGRVYLGRIAAIRRAEIERTLPGAVRYLRVLATGSNDRRELVTRVAKQEAYGETARSFQQVLNKTTLTGNLNSGLSMVARETPSRDLLSPFLLKFREHASQSRDSLEGYLEMESRLLSQRQERAHQRASGYMELIAELFVVMLVFPALAVLILTVASVLSPGLSKPVSTPVGTTSYRGLLMYGSMVFVLAVGLTTALTIASLRPTDHAIPTYQRPPTWTAVLRTATSNPASGAVVWLGPALVVVGLFWALEYSLANIVLLGYAAYGLPVGVVAHRRATRDDAKDREIQDFVHAVSGQVSLGTPFPTAVQRVADDVDFGPLQPDVEDLAFNLGLTTSVDETVDTRAAALDRFVERVGTPLASQTVGLVVGALEAGSNTENVFETLETEIGRLYHERKELRSRLMVYVAVGWTTALLVVGVVVAVNATVLDGFAQLSDVAGSTSGMAFDPTAINPERDRERFYLVTQATVIACGWFAGVASRGKYEALLHSGLLVVITYVIFTGLGVV
jgi:archaellum biogenesis protein FlaJ (TadC family)